MRAPAEIADHDPWEAESGGLALWHWVGSWAWHHEDPNAEYRESRANWQFGPNRQ